MLQRLLLEYPCLWHWVLVYRCSYVSVEFIGLWISRQILIFRWSSSLAQIRCRLRYQSFLPSWQVSTRKSLIEVYGRWLNFSGLLLWPPFMVCQNANVFRFAKKISTINACTTYRITSVVTELLPPTHWVHAPWWRAWSLRLSCLIIPEGYCIGRKEGWLGRAGRDYV